MYDINKSSSANLTAEKYNHDVTVSRRARPSRVALSDGSATPSLPVSLPVSPA